MRVVPAFQFIALVLAALALIPAGAHFFELPNKMALDGQAYLTVQQIYAGWSLFGIALIGSLAANLALAVAVRRERLFNDEGKSLLEFIDLDRYTILPNTAGCFTAPDAVRVARPGRDLLEQTGHPGAD